MAAIVLADVSSLVIDDNETRRRGGRALLWAIAAFPACGAARFAARDPLLAAELTVLLSTGAMRENNESSQSYCAGRYSHGVKLPRQYL